MNAKISYQPINWTNGMNISEMHLTQQYLAVLDRIKDVNATFINSSNYGLLGSNGKFQLAENFRDNINSEKVEVSFCRAITQNGSRVEILDKQWKELIRPMSELIEGKNLDISPYWYVILIIDPFLQTTDGVEVKNEVPRRKPFTRPTFNLELVSSDDLEKDNLMDAIPLAKFEKKSLGLQKVEEYIPPSCRLNSHKQLVLKHGEYDSILHQLKDASYKIINKIRSKKIKSNYEQNFLADDIEKLCNKYLEIFAEMYDFYKLRILEESPIQFIEFFSKLARVLLHTIESGNDKDHVFKYFHQYIINKKVAKLNDILKATFESEYIHYDIQYSLMKIDEFLNTFNEIFIGLVNLNYSELAPRNVIQGVRVAKSPRRVKDFYPDKREIKITHPGSGKYLGADLET